MIPLKKALEFQVSMQLLHTQFHTFDHKNHGNRLLAAGAAPSQLSFLFSAPQDVVLGNIPV